MLRRLGGHRPGAVPRRAAAAHFRTESLPFHDVLYLRHVLGLRPAPEFEKWLQTVGMADSTGRMLPVDAESSSLRQLTAS
jgi:ethanolamine ammonia-lyase large subunit